MLSIRLRRTGSSKRPHYRVVVTDSHARRDGRFVEIIGHYDPRRNPATVKIDDQRAQYWISKGARPSETVRNLLKQAPAAEAAPETAAAAPEAPAPEAAADSAEA